MGPDQEHLIMIDQYSLFIGRVYVPISNIFYEKYQVPEIYIVPSFSLEVPTSYGYGTAMSSQIYKSNPNP